MIIMFNLFSKYFIIMNLFIFTLLSLSFSDYIMIWFFMEITNFLFICLMNMNLKNKKLIFFYFIIQIMASFPIIMCTILNNIFMYNNYINLLMILALFMKLSIPPFHLWLPIISKHLSWNILFILLTLQKIMPFYMISLMKIHTLLIYLTLILCSIIPPYMMFNLYNFKMLLSYASINQTSWMIMLIFMKSLIWLKYFLFYSIILLILFSIISFYKILFNFKYSSLLTLNKFFNLMMIIIMLNMASMPPFSFFYMKWYSIFMFLQNSNLFFIFIIMMLSSLIMLYLYVNMMLNSMFFYQFKSKIQILKFTFNNNLNFIIQTSLLMSLIMTII